MNDELPMQLRGGIVQGVVSSVDDTGEVQTVTVETHDGVVRSGVPVASIHGLASNPSAGGITVLLAIEGDQGNLVALPISLPSARYGNLPSGGAVLYDDTGSRLAFPADGSGLLTVAGLLRLLVQTLRIEAPGGSEVHGPVVFTADVTMQANLHVNGDLTVDGNITVGGNITTVGTVNGHR